MWTQILSVGAAVWAVMYWKGSGGQEGREAEAVGGGEGVYGAKRRVDTEVLGGISARGQASSYFFQTNQNF